jgi:uncharacterized BrkB/YihY/UPF0761 family membrane protein
LPKPRDLECQTNPTRACIKMGCVAALMGGVLGLLITFVSRATVNDLRHHLTLWLIVALVAIINITSFLLFAIFWALYRWIRRDLQPAMED